MADLVELAPYRIPPSISKDEGLWGQSPFLMAFLIGVLILLSLIVFKRRKAQKKKRLERFERALSSRNRPEILALLEQLTGLRIDELAELCTTEEREGFLDNLYQSDTNIDWEAKTPQLMRLYKRLGL